MKAPATDGASRPRPIPKCTACGHYQIEHAAPTSEGGCRVSDSFGSREPKCPCSRYSPPGTVRTPPRPRAPFAVGPSCSLVPRDPRSYKGVYCADHFDGPRTKGLRRP